MKRKILSILTGALLGNSVALGADDVLPVVDGEHVVLLHGLIRTSNSMNKMQAFLEQSGYIVCNVGYPSTKLPIDVLTKKAFTEALKCCEEGKATKIHFVTHSLGGILVRNWLKDNEIPNLGRIVMLAPPNKGSEIVDKLGELKLFQWINGPAGNQLGTDTNSVPNQLGPFKGELGVITGDRSINPFLSMMIEGPDDGKVSVERAKVENMKEFKLMPVNHVFIMQDPDVMQAVLNFIRIGVFDVPGV